MKPLALILSLTIVVQCPLGCYAQSWHQYRKAAEQATQSGNTAEAIANWKKALKVLSGSEDPRYATTIDGLNHTRTEASNASVGIAKTSIAPGTIDTIEFPKRENPINRNDLPETRVPFKNNETAGHRRPPIDRSKTNNWSTLGNINPSTGTRGFIDPDGSHQTFDRTESGGTDYTYHYQNVNQDQVWVSGYNRDDGTHVPGYWRTTPNDTTADNLSARRGQRTRSATEIMNSHPRTRGVNSIMQSYGRTPGVNSIMRSYSQTRGATEIMNSHPTTDYSIHSTPSAHSIMQSLPRMTGR